MEAPMDPLTHGHFFNGAIVLNQPAAGYRFSIDAVILAHLAGPLATESVLDLGTGCGVIPIMLAYRHPGVRVTGVEIQPALAAAARQNVADNRMSDRVRILEADMRSLTVADTAGPVDLVVSNPPYRRLQSGRINAHDQKAIARHEIKIDLEGLIAAADRLLGLAGRFCAIYPAVRTVDLLTVMRASKIEPKRVTVIHSQPNSAAQLVVVSGNKGGRPGVEVAPPLYLYRADGTYTRSVEAMFAG